MRRVQVDIGDPEEQARIWAATQIMERHLGRCLVAQTWDMFLDDEMHAYPAILQSRITTSLLWNYTVELLKPPLLSLVGVYVTDDSGVETQVDPATYWVSNGTTPARISLQPGNVWPYHRGFEGFRVRVISGYVYPFTASGGVLTSPNHGLQNGQITRVQAGVNILNDGLEPYTDYVVNNATNSTLQLADTDGNIIGVGDSTDYNFLGEIPDAIRRAIVLMCAMEIAADSDAQETSRRFTPVTLSPVAAEMVDTFRIVRIS